MFSFSCILGRDFFLVSRCMLWYTPSHSNFLSETLNVVEEELELSLDEGYAIIKEEHDSSTLEQSMIKVSYF